MRLLKVYIFSCVLFFSCFSLYAQSNGAKSLYDDSDEERIFLEGEANQEKKRPDPTALNSILDDLEIENNAFLKKVKNMIDSGNFSPSLLIKEMTQSKSLKENNNRSKAIREGLSPFRKMKEKELRFLIKEKSKGSYLEEKLKAFPKMLDLIVNLLRDKNAFPSFIEITEKKLLGLIYFAFFIGTFILGYFLKRYALKKNLGFFRSIISSFKRVLFLMILRTTGFIFLFYGQLKPSLLVFYKTFF